jgi:hypothetical protein
MAPEKPPEGEPNQSHEQGPKRDPVSAYVECSREIEENRKSVQEADVHIKETMNLAKEQRELLSRMIEENEAWPADKGEPPHSAERILDAMDSLNGLNHRLDEYAAFKKHFLETIDMYEELQRKAESEGGKKPEMN